MYIEAGLRHVVIDTPPDFREQVLTFSVPRLDAVLYTHCHADHIFGFDDIRRFNVVQSEAIPVYGSAQTINAMNTIFSYVHQQPQPGLSYPRVALSVISEPFNIGNIRVEPLSVEHAGMDTFGYRIDCNGKSLGYVPDCHSMSEDVISKLAGVDVMILDALRRHPHPTHFTLDESVDVLQRIGANRSFITHIGHDLDHDETQRSLPEGVNVPYDGLVVSW